MSGKILNSRYKLDRRLGGGGLGDTYLAFDLWKEGDNRCVVKQLKPEIVNATTLRLFEKEAEALSKLGSHSQIPTLLAHFQQDDQFYLVQEFIEGHDLTEEIKLGECWQETAVIKLLQDILEVLYFVHQNHVIHRDIKPGNIMRCPDGKIVLIDFGGVKQVKNNPASTQSSVVVGTPGYMPFEQIYNNAQLCSDIYAVGMVAIAALTGENPVDVSIDPDTLQPVWRQQAQVRDEFASIINKMVQFHHVNRYQSVCELSLAINNLVDTASEWCEQGKCLLKQKHYAEAIAAFEQALLARQNYPEAFKGKGWALFSLRQENEALALFDRVLETQPDDYEALIGRGWALNRLEKYDEALVACERAVEIQPNADKAVTGRAWSLGGLGKHEEALVVYDQAIEINRDNVYAWTGRAWALNELGRYQDALASCEQAIKLDANYSDPWCNRGWSLYYLGCHEDALASFDRGIEIDPNDALSVNFRGWLLYLLARYDEALVYYEQALKLKPDAAYIWKNRGLSLYKLNDYKAANASFQKAVSYSGNVPEMWFSWGTVLLEQANYQRAIICYDTAIELKKIIIKHGHIVVLP